MRQAGHLFMQAPFYSAQAYVVIGVFGLFVLRLCKHLGHRTSRHSTCIIAGTWLKSSERDTGRLRM
jgi:hypothetical protein